MWEAGGCWKLLSGTCVQGRGPVSQRRGPRCRGGGAGGTPAHGARNLVGAKPQPWPPGPAQPSEGALALLSQLLVPSRCPAGCSVVAPLPRNQNQSFLPPFLPSFLPSSLGLQWEGTTSQASKGQVYKQSPICSFPLIPRLTGSIPTLASSLESRAQKNEEHK